MPEMQRQPAQNSVTDNNADENTNPLSRPPSRIAISLQHASPCDHTLRRQFRLVHAMATRSARVSALREFVDHHALEDIGLEVNANSLASGPTLV